jgi:hypothetical protein
VLDAEKPVLGAEPYVGGTLLAAQWGMDITGLVRGLDRLLFAS